MDSYEVCGKFTLPSVSSVQMRRRHRLPVVNASDTESFSELSSSEAETASDCEQIASSVSLANLWTNDVARKRECKSDSDAEESPEWGVLYDVEFSSSSESVVPEGFSEVTETATSDEKDHGSLGESLGYAVEETRRRFGTALPSFDEVAEDTRTLLDETAYVEKIQHGVTAARTFWSKVVEDASRFSEELGRSEALMDGKRLVDETQKTFVNSTNEAARVAEVFVGGIGVSSGLRQFHEGLQPKKTVQSAVAHLADDMKPMVDVAQEKVVHFTDEVTPIVEDAKQKFKNNSIAAANLVAAQGATWFQSAWSASDARSSKDSAAKTLKASSARSKQVAKSKDGSSAGCSKPGAKNTSTASGSKSTVPSTSPWPTISESPFLPISGIANNLWKFKQPPRRPVKARGKALSTSQCGGVALLDSRAEPRPDA